MSLVTPESLSVDLATDRISTAYDVVKPIGRGAFSVVYKATRRADCATVALKKICSVFDIFDERARETCLRIRLVQTLCHDNVIRCLDCL